MAYTKKHLEGLPTLSQGQTDNLKIERPAYRVWLSRMTVADGMEYDNQVTIERYVKNNWKVTDTYQAS